MLNITATQSDVYLAGMPFELRCSVTLDNTIDTRISVIFAWWRNGVGLNDTVRITTSQQQPALVGDYDVLRFDTLSSTYDSGNYACSATLYSTDHESRHYISNSTGTTIYTITVIGIQKLQSPYMLFLYLH